MSKRDNCASAKRSQVTWLRPSLAPLLDACRWIGNCRMWLQSTPTFQLGPRQPLRAMPSYEPLIAEKKEAKATDLGKTLKQLKHKKVFQEVVAAARVCGAI